MYHHTGVSRVKVVAMPPEVAASNVQLDVAAQQGARPRDQRVAEVRARPTGPPAPVNHAQPLTLCRRQRVRRKRLALPEPREVGFGERNLVL
jgi:hypothetical protein